MNYITLGRTGLKVSRLCLGMMTYGDPAWRAWVLPEEASRPFVKRALEAGINFFDTADMYSLGVSEEILGRAIRDFANRDRVVLATKVYPADERRSERSRALAQAHHDVDRRLAAAAWHRLRRPLPDPSLGYADANRGNALRAERHRPGRQGALHRRVEHGGVAIRAGAVPGRPARMDAVRIDAESLQSRVPGRGARDAAALPRPGHRRDSVEPAGARVPGGQSPRRRAWRHEARGDGHDRARALLRRFRLQDCRQRRRSRRTAWRVAGPDRAGVGARASPLSRHRLSARQKCRSSRKRLPRSR